MGTIIFHNGLGPGNHINTHFDWANLMLSGAGNTATLTDPDGNVITLQGTGLMYLAGSPSWSIAAGTVNSLTLKTAAGATLFEVSGSSADGAWLYDWIVGGTDLDNDVNSGPGRLWGTNDTVIGSDGNNDILVGSGDHFVMMGRGRDTFQTTGGDDTVTGGRGRDEFVENWNGSLTITDFTDVGPWGQQDVIRMTRWEYRNMTKTQVGDDVELVIPERGNPSNTHLITLLNYDLANLDRSDFVFGF